MRSATGIRARRAALARSRVRRGRDRLKGAGVMVVDASDERALALQELLEDAGCYVVTARSQRRARQIRRQTALDLVIYCSGEFVVDQSLVRAARVSLMTAPPRQCVDMLVGTGGSRPVIPPGGNPT